ncbi:hypothetical protein BGW80DRAFT_1256891 [Lactifluus volemus]|nr:hypothetical protein BGW80DRAFT_1256891 [Lactifluus volemus]
MLSSALYQQKMFHIEDHVGIAITGLTSDAHSTDLISKYSNFMRQQTMAYTIVFNQLVPKIASCRSSLTVPKWTHRNMVDVHTVSTSCSHQALGQVTITYLAVAIGGRSQSVKTYFEKHFECFADERFYGSLEDLIRPWLRALCETLQKDKELTTNNTSIGVLGPCGIHEAEGTPVDFRILERGV